MSGLRVRMAVGVATLGVVVTAGAALAGDHGKQQFRTALSGYEEVPALSTPGVGSFRAAVSRSGDEITYRLRYRALGTPVEQAHIHFEQRTNNGQITAFLCSNLPNPPSGTPACSANGVVEGTIRAEQVTAGAAAMGIDAGELDELVAAMRAGVTYVNVHTQARPGGEIRGQIARRSHRGRHQ